MLGFHLLTYTIRTYIHTWMSIHTNKHTYIYQIINVNTQKSYGEQEENTFYAITRIRL